MNIPFLPNPFPSPLPDARVATWRNGRTWLAVLLAIGLLLQGLSLATAQQRTSLPAAQQVLAAPSTSEGATCTSTDGNATCVCSADGGKCQAKATSCSCYGVPPPKPSSSRQAGPTSLALPGASLQATCTSGDGKKVCACGDKGCNAAEVTCSCLSN